MTPVEGISWACALWCFIFGVRSTLALTHFRKLKPPPRWEVLAFNAFVVVIQLGGLAFFLSIALWARTIRELGLVH